MSDIALREAHNAHKNKKKKRKPIHLGKINYVVGYDYITKFTVLIKK